MQIMLACPERDFPSIVDLVSAEEPGVLTLEMLRKAHYDAPPGRICRRTVMKTGEGEVLGYCSAVREAWFGDGEFNVWLTVDKAHRGRGIGSALYSDAEAFMRERGATLLTTSLLDNCPQSLAFAEHRGFKTDRHQYESSLDLSQFDFSKFEAVLSSLEASGIRLCSAADWGDTPDVRKKLFHLNVAVLKDIPGFRGNWMSFDEFNQRICGSTWYRPDGQLVALHGERWVGLSAVQLRPEVESAYNLITGVLPEYRRRGLATALKLQAIQWARENGAKSISTTNDSLNAPMLAINQNLGYRPQPGKYVMLADIR